MTIYVMSQTRMSEFFRVGLLIAVCSLLLLSCNVYAMEEIAVVQKSSSRRSC